MPEGGGHGLAFDDAVRQAYSAHRHGYFSIAAPVSMQDWRPLHASVVVHSLFARCFGEESLRKDRFPPSFG